MKDNMESGNNQVKDDWIYKPINFRKNNKESIQSIYWKVTVVRNILQVFIFLLAIYLPWYRLYRPPGLLFDATIIDAGAFDLGGQVVGLLLVALIISFIEVVWLLLKRNRKVSKTKILDIALIYPCLAVLGFIGDPIFKPGLGGLYSDYIRLTVLNWAGFQIIPMMGYLCVLLAIASVVISLVLILIFS
ncbi:MAG: hypothetical protein ACXAC8_09525 [Candidatus Hodarchaeales archaeon]|jgi:hypothetical protein